MLPNDGTICIIKQEALVYSPRSLSLWEITEVYQTIQKSIPCSRLYENNMKKDIKNKNFLVNSKH